MTMETSQDKQTTETNNGQKRNPLSIVPKPVWWMALGGLIVILLSVLFGLHPIDGWIHHLLSHHEDHEVNAPP